MVSISMSTVGTTETGRLIQSRFDTNSQAVKYCTKILFFLSDSLRVSKKNTLVEHLRSLRQVRGTICISNE